VDKNSVYGEVYGEDIAEVKLPTDILNKFEKLERGKSMDRLLRRGIADKEARRREKPERKITRNKKANRKKWTIPVKHG